MQVTASFILIFGFVFSVLGNGSFMHGVHHRAINSGRFQGEVVFIGASITQFWQNEGLPVWKEYYEPLGAVDVGVAGDATHNTIDRINGGFIDNLQSRVAILNIGNNDLSQGKDEPYVHKQIGIILGMIKNKLPGVKIILLQVLPRCCADIHQKARNVNALIRNYDDGHTVRYLDMEDEFCYGLGQVKPELYRDDLLHLKEAGYKMWAQTMAPLFNETFYGN